MCFFCGHASWLWCCTSRESMWAEDLPRVYINFFNTWTWISLIVNKRLETQVISHFFFRGWKHNHDPETICWCVPVKSKWIGLYMKSRLEIQVNEQRHKSASEDWYWESAAVSLCQGHGCHAVNNTWRLSLHVCFHFSSLKCQQWKERKRERRRKKIINTSLSQMHLVTCAGVLKKDDDILTSSWFCLVSVLRGPMGLCRNAFTFHSFIKMYVHFFCLFYIHSFIHFLCPVLLHSGGAGVVPQLSPGVKAGSRHGTSCQFCF